MSQPSNATTPEVIREIMPLYQLSPDLLQATLAAIPQPPPDATTAWRHAHIARLTQEMSALMPANAAQARIAAQVLIYRELGDTLATQAHASGTDIPLLCRLARTAATLTQTALMLDRSLTRHQQKPAPFFGTTLSDAVDVPALDATWRSTPDHQPQSTPDESSPDESAPNAASPPTRRPPDPPNPSPPGQPTPPSADLAAPEPQPPPQSDCPPLPPAHPDQQAAIPEWTRTKLDSGPGWSREVLRHRSSREADNDQAP